ncbi:MAG: signal peptidase I [Anaerolineae bacterium]
MFEESPETQGGQETMGDQDVKDRWQEIKSAFREIMETVLLTLLIFIAIRTLIQNFRIEGTSMEPNLHDGQYLIVNKLVYYLHPPERGDVVVFHYPKNPRRDFIKRVIGLPREKVEVRGKRILINGEKIEESYDLHTGNYAWGPRRLGEDEYFILGDNRNSSSDSHNWGPLPRDAIIGKAWISYWPPKYWGLVPHYSYAAAE